MQQKQNVSPDDLYGNQWADGGPWGVSEWVCFTTRWHSCLLKGAEMLKCDINVASPPQVGAPWAPLSHSHCLINASSCTLGSLFFFFFYFAKVRWEKMMSWLFKFWFPSQQKEGNVHSARRFLLLSCAAWLWINERSHWLNCQKYGVPRARSCKTPDSFWNHGHAVPPT